MSGIRRFIRAKVHLIRYLNCALDQTFLWPARNSRHVAVFFRLHCFRGALIALGHCLLQPSVARQGAAGL